MRIQRKLLLAGGVALVLGATLPAVAMARAGATAGPRLEAGPAAASTGLSPQQLAGQRVIYSYSGLNPPASLISLIQHGEAAGVIFFGQNIASRTQIGRHQAPGAS